MKDFGIFTAIHKPFELPPVQVGVDDRGEPIFSAPIKGHYAIMVDENGTDWHDLAQKFPHPFYIAINDDGSIYSMEQDYLASQIPGHLIGIDTSYGYTRGEGGTVYGKIWNGTAIVEPEPEPEVTMLPSVTLWERMTDEEAEQVEAAMSSQPFRTRQIFMTAKTFRSDHELWPLLEQMATELFGEMRASELLAPPV